MAEPIFTYCRELLPPSTVDRAVSLSFTAPGSNDLILARGNVLELYEVAMVEKKQRGTDDKDILSDEYLHRDTNAEGFDFPMIRDNAKLDRESESILDNCVLQLRLSGRWSLHGMVKDMQAVRCGPKGRRGVDSLLISFPEAKMSLISFEPATQSIMTESIHYYEHEKFKQKSFNDDQTCDIRVDPAGRCAVMRIYKDQLAVLPLIAPDESVSTKGSTKSYMESFVIDLRHPDTDVKRIRDFVFLNGYLEPTLAFLHEQNITWAGSLESHRDTCATTVVSLDLSRRSMSIIQAASSLPYDCQRVVPVPQPIGGMLIFAGGSVSHIVNGTLSCMSILNKAAYFGIGSLWKDFVDKTNDGLGLVLNLDMCEPVFISSDTVALWMQTGQVILLKLDGDGRRVERIVARQIAGVDPRTTASSNPNPELWESLSVVPTCAVELKMPLLFPNTTQREQYVFIGGYSGRSLLIGVENNNKQRGDNVGDLDPSIASQAPESTTSGTKAPSKKQSDEMDIDAILYGGASASATLPSENKADSPHDNEDGSDVIDTNNSSAIPVNAENKNKDSEDAPIDSATLSKDNKHPNTTPSSAEWHKLFKFTIHDELLGTGQISDMDIGTAANSLGRGVNDEGLELVSCAGNEWRGCLRIQQRNIRPDIIASFDLPGPPLRQVWTVRCRKEYNIGGIMQAADEESLKDLPDTFMVVSRDSGTLVFSAGDELQELEQTDFFTNGPTLEVCEILNHTRIIQVHPDGMLILNASGRQTQTFTFEHGQSIVSAEISDPYVLLKTSLNSYMLFEADSETCKLSAITVPSVLENGDVLATSFFEDTHAALPTTKGWLEQNPEALIEKQQLSEALVPDSDIDYLYADSNRPGKRRIRSRINDGRPEKRNSRRKHANGFSELYGHDEGDTQDNDASLGEASAEKGGDPQLDTADFEQHDENDASGKGKGGMNDGSPVVYLFLACKGGDLRMLQLPDFDEVWRSPRFDYLSDVLVGTVVDSTHVSDASSNESDSEDENSNAQENNANMTDKSKANGQPPVHSTSLKMHSQVQQLDQFAVVQLGGNGLHNINLVALTTSGKVVVYRAFEYCESENINNIRAARSAPSELQDSLSYLHEIQLAVRFVRVSHSAFAYEPEYEDEIQKVNSQQMQVFKEWEKREQKRVSELEQAEMAAREKAKARQRKEASGDIVDWDESDGDDSDSGGGDDNLSIGHEQKPDKEEKAGSISEASLEVPDKDEKDSVGADNADFDSTLGRNADRAEEDDINSTGDKAEAGGENAQEKSLLLSSTRKFTVLDNFCGYSALFISGPRPLIVLVGSKQYPRVHPLSIPVKLPSSLKPPHLPKEFDPVKAGLLTPHRPIVGLARFHSTHCPHGLVALTQAGTLTIAVLPTSAQEASGGIEYDAPWPTRCIPPGTAHSGVGSLGGVSFHQSSGSYAAITTSIIPFHIKEPDPEIAAKVVEDEVNAAEEVGDSDSKRHATHSRFSSITPDQLDPQQALIPEHQRPNLSTTSAPPLVPRFHIDLLSPNTWETVDSHEFEYNEHVVAMSCLELESRQTAERRKAFLCVATGFILGEDVTSRGKVYIFDVVEVVPLPGRPQTNRKFKLLFQEEIRGTITALGEMRGYLAISVGSKIFIRSFEDNEKLISVAFLDCQSWVKSLSGMKSFLLVGDLVNSIWFTGFQEEGPTKVQVLGRDFYNKLSVERAEFLTRGNQVVFLVADMYGQLHFFVYAPHDAHSFKGQKLLRHGEYNLHSQVTCMKRIVSPSTPDGHQQQVSLVATETGAVYGVAAVPERIFKRMHRMNTQLIHGTPPLAGLNPREYRSVPLHLRQYHSPKRTVLDADILIPLFAHGSLLRQRETAQRVGTTADRVLRDIVNIEHCFPYF